MDQAPEAAADVPGRPPAVPREAEWLPGRELWELAERGAAGENHGEVRQWRTDGSLYLHARNEHGRLAGAFTIYHPNGQVAREGHYQDGELEGLVTSFAADGDAAEPLRSCCVPANAWQMKSSYQRGSLHGEIFYDRQGFPLLSDGTRRPERPSGLPASAEYDEFAGRWGAGGTDDNGTWKGPWRFWTVEGRLDEEAEYRDTRKAWSRLYDGEGALRHEISYEGDGVLHGPYRRRFVEAGESPYADQRIVEERGAY